MEKKLGGLIMRIAGSRGSLVHIDFSLVRQAEPIKSVGSTRRQR